MAAEAVGDETFQSADRNRLVYLPAAAGRLTTRPAHAAADRSQWVRPAGNQIRIFDSPLGNRPHVAARIRVYGTGVLTPDLPLPVPWRWNFDSINPHSRFRHRLYHRSSTLPQGRRLQSALTISWSSAPVGSHFPCAPFACDTSCTQSP